VPAGLVAVDLATGQAIALTPWSDVPKGLKLLSTQRTDANGAFDFELPKLAENQIVKLVATKGGQTFTALFNSRGQTIGADTPTTATYKLQQGTAVSVTIRLRLTAGSTAATQAFEGALKLTFQLPVGTSAERQSAVLEAARKAAQDVEAALAKKPEVAARLVAAVNAEGAVNSVENFRTAVTNLGVFDAMFKAVQAELLAVAAQKLEVRKDLSPIRGSEFPLDQVVISPSGLFGFSGQRNPINLGGAVTTNFVPTPPRGGGSGVAAPSRRPSPWTVYPSSLSAGWVDGLAYLRGRNALVMGRDFSGIVGQFHRLELGTGVFTNLLPSFDSLINGVSQTQNSASETVFVGSVHGETGTGSMDGIYWYEPETSATGTLVTGLPGSGQLYAVGAGRNHVYAVRNGANQAMTAYSQTDPTASYVVHADTGPCWRSTVVGTNLAKPARNRAGFAVFK
jgi:hypothetical protein